MQSTARRSALSRTAHLSSSNVLLRPISTPTPTYLLNRLARDVRKIPDGQKDERGQADQHDYRIHSHIPPMYKIQMSVGSLFLPMSQ